MNHKLLSLSSLSHLFHQDVAIGYLLFKIPYLILFLPKQCVCIIVPLYSGTFLNTEKPGMLKCVDMSDLLKLS